MSFTPGPRLSEALAYAVAAHGDQRRKGTDVPYVTHLLAVAGLVGEHGGDEDTMIAALLHDVVEDCGGMARLEEIRAQFGETVATVVLGCTDDDGTQPDGTKPPWRPRKEAFVAQLATAPREVLRVTAADKLHNARTLLADYRDRGERVWDNFRGGRTGSLWYYRAVTDAIGAREDALDESLRRLWRELDLTVRTLEELADRSQ